MIMTHFIHLTQNSEDAITQIQSNVTRSILHPYSINRIMGCRKTSFDGKAKKSYTLVISI